MSLVMVMTLFVNTSKKGIRTLYIHKKYRDENGKSTTKVVERLGTYEELAKIHDDPIAWGKAYAAELTAREKENSRKVMISRDPSVQITANRKNKLNGGYLFPQKIYHELGLHEICRRIEKKHRFEYDLDAILSRLIYGRILFPTSKLSTMEYSRTLLEQPGFELHQIYRALEVLASEDDFIQSELYRNSRALGKRNDTILYYDCTNYYFELEQADGIRQYGYSKENRPNPIVEMGMFMDGDGIPLAFCIHPGNTNEQTTLKPLEKKIISDFEHSEFVVCTDAGLSSYANRKYNSILNRRFITVQSIKMMKEEQKEWALSPEGWHIPHVSGTYHLDDVKDHPEEFKDVVFYKEQWVNENGLEQRYIVSFSLKYMEYTRSLRERHILRAQNALDHPEILARKRTTDYKRFIDQLEFDDQGTIVENRSYILNEDRIRDEARYDGFYAVATNLEDDASAILEVNAKRWQIEECFRIMKSEFKARPVYLSREDRIRAHFLTCFLALYVYRYIEKKLDSRFTCQQILSALRTFQFALVPGDGYLPLYERSEVTDALHEAFGFRTDFQIVTNAAMKQILKFTKS